MKYDTPDFSEAEASAAVVTDFSLSDNQETELNDAQRKQLRDLGYL
jgi:hypothetical protein